MEILAEAEVLDAAVMENPVWVAVFWAAVLWTLLWIASSLTSFIKLRLITNCMKVCLLSVPQGVMDTWLDTDPSDSFTESVGVTSCLDDEFTFMSAQQ
jgi:hypothetical protein